MTGGILQIVAHGIEDLFITGDPEITLFRIVYRRYTNFSIEDKVLKFRSSPNFGREVTCKLRTYGDLIHKMHIVFDIPKINLIFIVLTVGTTKTLLQTVGITWNTTKDDSEELSDAESYKVNFATTESGGNYDNKYWLFDTMDENYYVWYDSGSATDPMVENRTGIQVVINGGDSPITIADETQQAINASSADVTISYTALDSCFTITNNDSVSVMNAHNADTPGITFDNFDDLSQIEALIDARVLELEGLIDDVEAILVRLSDDCISPICVSLLPEDNTGLSTDDYLDLIISELLTEFDDLTFIYRFARAFRTDYAVNKINEDLINIDQLIDLSFISYRNQILPKNVHPELPLGSFCHPDATDCLSRINFHGYNYVFINNIDITNYTLTTNQFGISAGDLFLPRTIVVNDADSISYKDELQSLQEKTTVTFTSTGSLGSYGGKYWLFNTPKRNYYVWYNVDGASTDPKISQRIGIEVSIATSDTNDAIATATAAAINMSGVRHATATYPSAHPTLSTSSIDVINDNDGAVVNASNIDVNGLEFRRQILFNDVVLINQNYNNKYWTFDTAGGNYYVWYYNDIEANGTDPNIPGRTGIFVQVVTGDGTDDVRTNTVAAINAVAGVAGHVNVDGSSSNYFYLGDSNGSISIIANISVPDMTICDGSIVTVDYKTLDAYILFNNYFSLNPNTLDSFAEVDLVKQAALDFIDINLRKNGEMFGRIFEVLDLDYKFSFYKRYPESSGSYDITGSFSAYSLETPLAGLEDNFSDQFTITSFPSEPVHPYGDYVRSFISPFHNSNATAYNTSVFQNYFNNIQNATNMWSVIRIGSISLPAGTPTDIDELHHLNWIPTLTANDILAALDAYLQQLIDNEGRELDSFKTALDAALAAVIVTLNTILVPSELVTSADVDYLNLLGPDKKSGDDRLFTAIFKRPNNTEDSNPIRTIVNRMRAETVTQIGSYVPGGGDDALTAQEETDLLFIVDMFCQSASTMMDFSTYVNNGYTFFVRAGVNPLKSAGTVPTYSDAISAIWCNLMDSKIANYNNFYDNQVLLQSYLDESVGAEIGLYKRELVDPNIPGIIGVPNDFYNDPTKANAMAVYDAFEDTSDTLGVGGMASVSYNDTLLAYKNKYNSSDMQELLDVRTNTIANKQDYFYTDIITAYTQIKNNFLPISTDQSFIIDAMESEIIGCELLMPLNRYSVVDNNLDEPVGLAYENYAFTVGFSEFSNITNNFPVGSELNSLHDDFGTEGLVFSEQNTLFTTPTGTAVGSYTAADFDSNKATFASSYNGLAEELDLYNYLVDQVILQSSMAPLLNLKGPTNQVTYDNVIAYYNNLLNGYNEDLEVIKGPGNDVNGPNDQEGGLLNLIDLRRFPNTRANFAWIRKLGLFLIDHVAIFVGGQLIDKHSGEYLFIKHEQTKRREKERGYQIMIGDIERMYTYDDNGKTKMRLYIPLRFWFNEVAENSLPMIALTRTDVELRMRIKGLNEVAYWQGGTEFKPQPKLSAFVLAQYIYVEPEERKRLVKSKHEYLIDTVQQTPGVSFIGRHIDGERQDTMTRVHFKYPCKELIWIYRDQAEINGSKLNGEINYHIFMSCPYVPTNLTGTYTEDPIPNCLRFDIRFNGRVRQQELDGGIFELLEPYKHHTAIPANGIYMYNFGLHPEQNQPSGAANLSKIDHMDIKVEADELFRNDLIDNQTVIDSTVYGIAKNVFRVFSGMGALAFFE